MVRRLRDVLLVLVVGAIAIAVSLWVTPMQSVDAAGQTVRVGAAAPTLSWSGPGEVDLFGQQLPTTIDFIGPVRPRLELTRITLSRQLAELTGHGSGNGAQDSASASEDLRGALVTGWRDYLIWQVVVVAGVSMVLLGAAAGWQRRSFRGSVALVLIGMLLAETINIGAIMTTAFTAPDRLRQVNSLQALVGAAPAPNLTGTAAPPAPVTGKVVVIGDSTAAGIGNPPLPDPTADDTACQRSVGSYAHALDTATDWQVTNLACSSATLRNGLLGPQRRGSTELAPQLPAALAENPSAVIISVGANDVGWSGLIAICAALADCGNAAIEAYFQQQLAEFTRNYLVLLSALRNRSEPPVVLVNQYYDPLGGDLGCIEKLGITDAKRKVLQGWLTSLNEVLAEGAQAADFATTRPDFTGHGLCAKVPYAQGMDDSAPLHPNVAGGLAIALADQAALRNAGLK